MFFPQLCSYPGLLHSCLRSSFVTFENFYTESGFLEQDDFNARFKKESNNFMKKTNE